MTFQELKAKRILFTGGGSAGHVTPNIAVIKAAEQKGWHVAYVGTADGIERQLIEPLHIPFYVISSGKLQRQLTLKNLWMPWRVLAGVYQAYRICRKFKPDVVFSKGGFVAVPLVIAAWLNGVPVIAHESDLTPGLANKISYPFVKKIAVSFPESIQHFAKRSKVVYTGTPVRPEVLQSNPERGRQFLNFADATKPIIFIYGGGLGSVVINQAVRRILPELLQICNIVHCCGQAKTDVSFDNLAGYRQFDYLNKELPDILAAADMVISRAGANSLYELLSLAKPNLLIPLSKKASRGDQIDNAKYFHREGFSEVLFEENLTSSHLLAAIKRLWQNKDQYKTRMQAVKLPDAVGNLLNLLN